MVRPLNWAIAICPICFEKYQYIEGHEAPKTCGKFDCLQKYFVKGIRNEQGQKINPDRPTPAR